MVGILDRVAGFFRRSTSTDRIAVLDDVFPNPISGFRFEEFQSYLEELPGISIHCDGNAFPLVGESRPVEDVVAEHLVAYPAHAGRVHRLIPGRLPDADAYYLIFLNNIWRYVDAIERSGKPFAFTLYPGGGFQIDDAVSDTKLDRVCTSPLLGQIIVPQPIIRDYLLNRHPGLKSKMRYILGGMIPRMAFSAPRRKHFGIDKETLDIAFVANRYTPRGEDKGYDLFVETAHALDREGVQATYHVVGPWDPSIVPLKELSAHFVFHGFATTAQLRELAKIFDLILSPNRPNVLAKGAFDGFPTGSCVEVGLQEAAIFCTDILNLNPGFRDGVDIVIVEPSVDDILRRLLPMIRAPRELAKIGANGRLFLTKFFGRAAQLPPRLAVLRMLASS